MKLLNSRVPIAEALENPHLDESKKQKLKLAQEARIFAETVLHLKPTKNYTTYVELDQPYVTYVISAASKWQLKQFQWSYPFMGRMPYKGYFKESDALDEAQELKDTQSLDVYVRGVSAYSTLGWFNDPLLSSMLRYRDYDLVNTIIHETVHATLFIKHAADFNERLATFLGNKGAELFYLEREGSNSATLQLVKNSNEDDKVFSKFISTELDLLEKWYAALPVNDQTEKLRRDRFKEIQNKFTSLIKPQLKTDNYLKFPELELNNARLLIYRTYMRSLNDLEELYLQTGSNFEKFIATCRTLESAKNPDLALKELISVRQ